MTILLDTHILLWALTGSGKLSTNGHDLIVDPTNAILASSINIAEIAKKSSIHKLSIASSLESENYAGLLKAIEDSGFEMLPFTAEHAAHLRSLPFHHRDPFDRMIISQAIHEKLSVLTADPVFESYPVKTLT